MFVFNLIWHRNQNQRNIHPDNFQAVNRAREELGIQRPPPEQHENGASSTNRESGEGEGQGFRRRRYNTDPTCPICLTEMTYATETNCGHVFCGK